MLLKGGHAEGGGHGTLGTEWFHWFDGIDEAMPALGTRKKVCQLAREEVARPG
jgi:hypothetical protein